MNLIPIFFRIAQSANAALVEAAEHERALYIEALHNCAWLDALKTTARANDPRFVDAIACLRIEAHEAFLAGQFGENETIAVKAPTPSPATANTLRLGASEMPVALVLEDDEQHEATHDVVLAQAVAYVVHQVTLMRTVATNREVLGDLLADVRGGTRVKNLGRVEHAIRKALVEAHDAIAPSAGVKGVHSA